MQFIRNYIAVCDELPTISDPQLLKDFFKNLFGEEMRPFTTVEEGQIGFCGTTIKLHQENETILETLLCYPANHLRYCDKVMIIIAIYIAIEKRDFEMISKITTFIESK